ncbi:hypothetical protein VFPFJ_07425 [Purpureocillium lilacinum]|uniref:Uncharacterized protein n=1 Tax=Purpureocillium lilacinum TaxID=33203 RepID=A0A179GQL1_PURLI|nr:hypothetical protein VFPFJ_07425 [Purpureocillium lilacinum]OAQ79640.1 hypothetical protein VFPBJ_05225 [Purpureocillium lilacinum]OAQ88960.1 hypothetical protein VFPFJ_07425 [Purpureocillium lilacinum]
MPSEVLPKCSSRRRHRRLGNYRGLSQGRTRQHQPWPRPCLCAHAAPWMREPHSALPCQPSSVHLHLHLYMPWLNAVWCQLKKSSSRLVVIYLRLPLSLCPHGLAPFGPGDGRDGQTAGRPGAAAAACLPAVGNVPESPDRRRAVRASPQWTRVLDGTKEVNLRDVRDLASPSTAETLVMGDTGPILMSKKANEMTGTTISPVFVIFVLQCNAWRAGLRGARRNSNRRGRSGRLQRLRWKSRSCASNNCYCSNGDEDAGGWATWLASR